MHVVVPYAADAPKTRLAAILSADERRRLARVMLEDVVTAVRETGREPTVLSTRPISDLDAPVAVDERSLSPAVNAVLAERLGTEPVAVVMADLPLATPSSLERLFDAPGAVVAAPGRGVGTNALVVRHRDFRVDYHGGSFLDHRAAARALDATFETVDSFRLGTDVDEPADLVEVIVHGRGRTPALVRELGIELDRTDGRLGIDRPDDD